MPWTGDWTTCIGRDIREMAADLVAAATERKTVSGSSVSIPSALAAGQDKLTWCLAWETMMDSLLTEFVDSSDSSGDWSGVSTAAEVGPALTEARILSAIGAGSRLPAAVGADMGAVWYKQQYDMMNKLIYTKDTVSRDASYTLKTKSALPESTFAAAVAAFEAASWISAGGVSLRHQASYNSVSGEYQIERVRQRFSVTAPTAAYAKTIEIYGKFLDDNFPGETYENNDFPGAANNTYDQIHLDSSPQSDVTSLIVINSIETNSMSDPTAGGDNTNYWDVVGGGIAILRWNVAGGLSYVA